MERLIDFFDKIDPLKENDKKLMRPFLTMLTLKKGDLAYQVGKVCNRIGFVVEGVLRVSHIVEDGTEHTKYFINEGHFCVDLESYSNLTPSTEYQEALTDCTMVMVSREAMDYFHKHIPNFTMIVAKVTEKALLEKYHIKSEMITDDAKTRYFKLMERNPGIVQRVPLGYISSYLGVTQSTLSRIRSTYR